MRILPCKSRVHAAKGVGLMEDQSCMEAVPKPQILKGQPPDHMLAPGNTVESPTVPLF